MRNTLLDQTGSGGHDWWLSGGRYAPRAWCQHGKKGGGHIYYIGKHSDSGPLPGLPGEPRGAPYALLRLSCWSARAARRTQFLCRDKTRNVFVSCRILRLCRAHPRACSSGLNARIKTSQILGLRKRPDQTGLFSPLRKRYTASVSCLRPARRQATAAWPSVGAKTF